jgi:NitT/TauT family transport system permease protein
MEFLDDRIVFWRRETRRAAASRAKARAWNARMGQ